MDLVHFTPGPNNFRIFPTLMVVATCPIYTVDPGTGQRACQGLKIKSIEIRRKCQLGDGRIVGKGWMVYVEKGVESAWPQSFSVTFKEFQQLLTSLVREATSEEPEFFWQKDDPRDSTTRYFCLQMTAWVPPPEELKIDVAKVFLKEMSIKASDEWSKGGWT